MQKKRKEIILNEYIGYNNSGSDSSSGTIFVSLYLILLAFFIMLNSISEQNQKKQAEAINSLNSAFSGVKGDAEIISNKSFNFNQIISDYYDEISTLSHLTFQLDDAVSTKEGNKIIISFPSQSFFKNNSVEIKSDKEKFLRKLAEITTQNSNIIKTQVKFTIGSNKFLYHSSGDSDYSMDILRAGMIIHELLDKGVNKDYLTTGIFSQDSGYITIEFQFSM